ncbi:MAG TPA: DUF4956 domain-containing protein [Pyrinomonadaceae bacterium]|jgi:hypothetical protein|nr:DUF4956 domain-containing protein [Pyrinomonadaceae bacterium]
MNKQLVRLLVVFVAVLIGSGLLVYILLERRTATPVRNVPERAATAAPQPDDTASPAQAPADMQTRENRSVLSEIFGIQSPTNATTEEERGIVAIRVLLRFLVAAFLAMLLAFRWRRGMSITKRNPYVAQTQILLAVVAAAMMIIVGDSAARAFGIFAAASLVRFRTNIRDPKETTVLLICLGVGLACGVGRLDMALILTVFVLVVLWILEHFESAQIFRSMEVRVETLNLDRTRQVLKNLFDKHGLSFEVRQLERGGGEGERGKIVYELSLGYADTTDQLSEEIFSEDSENIAALEWEQKKSSTYIYN